MSVAGRSTTIAVEGDASWRRSTSSERVQAQRPPGYYIVTTGNVVLVVDDDPSTQRSVQRLLRLRGFATELFDSGEQLLAGADLHAAVCLVLDIHLPGMSGIQVRRRIACFEASLPVIFMTANDSDVTRKAAMAAGCVAYLSKPFSSQTLVSAIDTALAARRHAD